MGFAELNTIDKKLEAYLSKEIAIPASARSSASSSQNYLRQVLRNKANTDTSFPELLSRNDADFLGGSFARHTKIWPLDDIDLFLPLDGGGLSYVNNGYRLPFTIATDTGTSRLLLSRWQTNTYIDSTKVLNGLRDALRDTYSSSIVKRDKNCVNLQTTIAATAESDGIGFDVVSCFRLIPEDGSEFCYLVPNGSGGWIRSNPRKDTDICAELHKYHGETYRKAVRLVKYWNKTQVGGAFTSYYIELALSKKFRALKQQNTCYGYILHAFATAIAELRSAYECGDQAPLIPAAPLVAAPMLTDMQKTYLSNDATLAHNALIAAFNNSQPDVAFKNLNSIFTTGFFG